MMDSNNGQDDNLQDQTLPLPVQIFLWGQLSPFIRPKLGKHHEATCTFCQQAPGHHELKEACKSFEKVLVQNISFGLSPSLTAALRAIPRWRLIQAAFPHVMHCAANLLHNRKDTHLQSLGATETKMLYTLHWIILLAAEECADADHEAGVFQASPFYYLFSIPSITLFIHLFAPIFHHLKESDFQTFRLENGLKMWQALWEYRHPDTPCFTAHVKPKPRTLWHRFIKDSHLQFGDVFLGRQQSGEEGFQFDSPISPMCDQRMDSAKVYDVDEVPWVSSPKDTSFPETIPEESSSTEEEHVVIFRLPSISDADSYERSNTFFTADASIFQVAMSRPSLTIEQVTAVSGSDQKQQKSRAPPTPKITPASGEKEPGYKVRQSSGHKIHGMSHHAADINSATFLDVAVLRCLFMSQWPEEGVYWALQFYYHRLREMSEETFNHQMPRKRSNSLPIPKIEISFYQSPEMKKKDATKDFIEIPDEKDSGRLAESPYFGRKQSEESISHIRRSSEKASKKKKKIADLRAFVETKLLSKSERTLVHIGQEEPQLPFITHQVRNSAREHHHSLDTGDDHLTRPASILFKNFESPSGHFGWGNLVKGKSMPSLRYVVEQEMKHVAKSRGCTLTEAHSHPITNPIITVTEHSPLQSPDNIKKHLTSLAGDSHEESTGYPNARSQMSIDSQVDDLSGKSGLNYEDRKPSLTRSHTDSNITYSCEDLPEAPGAAYYITKHGDIDIQVVLKAVHAVALRTNVVCTLRVCEVIFNILELLMEMGVLKSKDNGSVDSNDNNNQELKENEKEKERAGSDQNIKNDSGSKFLNEKQLTCHNLVLNTVLRAFKHLGCPHGCADGQRGPPADFLRSQGQNLLLRLHHIDNKQFSSFLRGFVKENNLPDIMELFHAYLGFCVDPTSLLSPLNQKRSSSKSPDVGPQGGYSTNFGAGLSSGTARGAENHVLTSVFRTLVTRLVKANKELKAQDNVPLYCDVRQLMTYIKEAHGGVFRRVALSGLLDSISRPDKVQNQQTHTTRVIRRLPHSDLPDEHDSGYFMDEKGQKRVLLKKRSMSSCAQTMSESETTDDWPSKSQSPVGNVKKRLHPTLTPRQSEKNLTVLSSLPSSSKYSSKMDKPKLIPKIGGIVSWFKKEHGRSDSVDSHEGGIDVSALEAALQRQQSVKRGLGLGKSQSKDSSGDLKQAIKKTKKQMEDRIKWNFGFKKGKKKDGSLEESAGTTLSRRSSVDPGFSTRDSDYIIYRERKLVSLAPVLNGMMRFSFLLDTCQPGSVPDQHLLAAILDLPHAPVVARASLLLECAFFVHNCNKGQWPTWMKLNLPVFRPSMPTHARGLPSGMRRTHILQKSARRLFYQWAEALGSRLEDMLQEDKRHISDVVNMVTDESHQKQLLVEDDEEDFLDEASVNISGKECPIALRMIACILLLEITAFLRETYQTLPKPLRTSARDRPPPWERMYSKDANRRWSMALSSMGHSQASAQSLQSIAGEAAGQPERKISFVLHEPDNESEGSSNTTVTMQGEDGGADDKDKERKSISRGSTSQPPGRPFLLRRGTATNATGSFKRRSLKLRRGTKEGIREIDIDFKRTDSIQSKRKVSSLSDRSDTSEQGGADISGEESPGVLSDDQPPESPSDSNETDDSSKNMPWMKTVVQVAHSFNFYCSHQSFCHPFCYRRQMRACERLIRAVRKVYGEENILATTLDSNDVSDKEKDPKNRDKSRNRKISDQQQTSPVHRKGSLGRKDRVDYGKHRDSDQDVGKEPTKINKTGSTTSQKDNPPILRYIKTQVRNVFHAPLSVLVKGAAVLTEDIFIDILPVAWELLLESDQEVAASAASLFILCAVRAPNHVSDLMYHGLSHQDVSVRINALLRFQVLWKLRYQVWPRMEEGANVTFKVPPPGIEFTLPSPKIGIESIPVVDPPWLPQVKAKVEEMTIRRGDHRFLVALTKTRRKQQMEMITMAMEAQENQTRSDRETFLITATSITEEAACHSTQKSTIGDDHDEVDEEQLEGNQARLASHHVGSIQSLFPSCLCSSVLQIIALLDDCAVSSDGCAVYEVAYSIIWNCLVEDSPLFLRYIFERITREKQEQMFKILRHLIRFVPKLPQQAAFSLYNYIIGYVMFYVRTPHEDGQQFIGIALSALWMVVHSVHGIMFKDLKQILRKEQCDASILLTSNVPHAKRIIVHGPQEVDTGGIPSQFPVQEDTQFIQILRESLDFFGIEEDKHNEYFLVDNKTRQIHNPSSYVRDFYFFKRSQYPQLELVHMEPSEAFNALQRQELVHKFVEIGKVLLTWAILKNVDMVVQRVVFLHEELMKLPAFPRKALEADLDLYKGGELGKELLGLDVLHKFMWVRLIARMFEAMAGNFAYSGDIHLFLNVLNGAIILHTEDSCILRYVVATYINAAHNFKNIFSTNGYLLIMPTLLQIYSNHQTNKLVTRTVEYCVKQFYLMNRKPFILQMFGSLSAILDTDEEGQYGDAHKVQAKCLFTLLLSLETPSPDPLNIGELVREEKPLKAIDFCYHDESEMVTVLDCISLCVMVIAYASDSVRGHQMLITLEAILPQYLQHIQKPVYEKEGKTEREIIQQLSSAIRTLIHNCEALGKNYNGPQRSSPEHKGSSQRNFSRGPYSPGFDFEDETRYISDHGKNKIHYDRDNEDCEGLRSEFRRPRDILLSLVADFYTKCSVRLTEMPKKSGYDGKTIELLDIRSHLRLVDVAHSLLKVAPYDPDTMACTGLQRYMNDILPFTDWSNEAMRPALITILRRLDKTFSKIYKKPNIRRHTDWDAATGLLKGVYETLARFPYIVHMQHLKTLINTCQLLVLGDTSNLDISGTEPLVVRVLMSILPPPHFCSISIKLILLQILAMGDNYSLEHVCGGNSVFPEKKKAENTLMNLIMPLCLRVGSGRKDVPKMRPQDVSFAVSIILHTMNPPANKIAPLTAQNIKSLSEMRSGSLAFGRDVKKPVRLPQSTYQISFLALKILIICFENELTIDWLRIAKTVREVGRIWDLGNVFWSFLDFVASQRTPLFPLLLPFMNEKVNIQPMNEAERHMQFIIREKLRGFSVPITKCRAVLLMDLAHEMKNLKEELENGKPVDDRTEHRSGDQLHSVTGEVTSAGHAKHHRPSIIGLFSSPAEVQSKAGAPQHSNPGDIPLKSLQSQRNSVTSVCEKPEIRHSAPTTVNSGDTSATTADESLPKASTTNLRGETSMTPLSPASPIDESSSEFSGHPGKVKLQRNKAQSRKTFRLRRSQKKRIDRPELQKGQRTSYSTPATPTQLSLQENRDFIEQLKQQQQQKTQLSQIWEKLPEANQSNEGPSKPAKIPSPQLLKTDSLDDDTSAISQTSSTSGYRESCSLITMTAESPTLLRPGSSREIPATTSPESSLTSNGRDDDEDDDEDDEEETAVLARSSSSQHSLLMYFEAQDEDTLI